jgi:hypothetical protein
MANKVTLCFHIVSRLAANMLGRNIFSQLAPPGNM